MNTHVPPTNNSQSDPIQTPPETEECTLHSFSEEYCDACHSFGGVFSEQRSHSEDCKKGALVAFVVHTGCFLRPNQIHHFIHFVFGIDTRILTIIPSPELFLCGYCQNFYPRSIFLSHVLFCHPGVPKPPQPVRHYLFENDYERNAVIDSTKSRNSLLNHIGVPITFAFLSPVDFFH